MSAAALKSRARRAARPHVLVHVARIGFVARGLVYGVVGVLSLQIAWGRGPGKDQEASREGALQVLAQRSVGRVLLALLAVGLVGYIVWRATQAVWGTDDEDDDQADIGHRVAAAAKALGYSAFLWSTVKVVVSGPSGSGGSGDEQEQALTARIMGEPGGRLLIAAVGLAIIGFAAWSIYRGLAQKFDKRLDTSQMSQTVDRVVGVTGTVGLGARGLVYGLAGWLLVIAALDYDPEQAAGLDGTLRTLAHQPYGKALLSVTAVGLLLFAVYSLFEARYREL